MKSVVSNHEAIVLLRLLTPELLIPAGRLGTLPHLPLRLRASRVLLCLDAIGSLQRCQEHLVAWQLALIWEQVLVLELLLYIGIGLRLGIGCRHKPVDLQVCRYLLLFLLRCRRVLLLSAHIALGRSVVACEEWVQGQAAAAVD